MATMQVELVSPEKVIFSGEATQVITRTAGGGEIAFLPGHAPFLGELVESHTRITLADGSVLDVAELAEDIDRARALASKERAEEVLRREHDADCAGSLARAHARLQATDGITGTPQGSH